MASGREDMTRSNLAVLSDLHTTHPTACTSYPSCCSEDEKISFSKPIWKWIAKLDQYWAHFVIFSSPKKDTYVLIELSYQICGHQQNFVRNPCRVELSSQLQLCGLRQNVRTLCLDEGFDVVDGRSVV